MVDTHLINMFILGFGIAAGAIAVVAASIIAVAAARRNSLRMGGSRLAAARAWTPLPDTRTREAKAALAAFSEPGVRESERDLVLR